MLSKAMYSLCVLSKPNALPFPLLFIYFQFIVEGNSLSLCLYQYFSAFC